MTELFKELMHNLLKIHFSDSSISFNHDYKRKVISARIYINQHNLPTEYMRVFYGTGWRHAKETVFMRPEDQDGDMPCPWTIEQVLDNSFFPVGINVEAEFAAAERLKESMIKQAKKDV
jgi:hypothetical protein